MKTHGRWPLAESKEGHLFLLIKTLEMFHPRVHRTTTTVSSPEMTVWKERMFGKNVRARPYSMCTLVRVSFHKLISVSVLALDGGFKWRWLLRWLHWLLMRLRRHQGPLGQLHLLWVSFLNVCVPYYGNCVLYFHSTHVNIGCSGDSLRSSMSFQSKMSMILTVRLVFSR